MKEVDVIMIANSWLVCNVRDRINVDGKLVLCQLEDLEEFYTASGLLEK